MRTESQITVARSSMTENLPAVNKSQYLTPRQRRFAVRYLQSLNATEAARQAGYHGDNLAAIGSRLLRRPQVREFIGKQLDDVMSADRVILKAQIVRLWEAFMLNNEQPAHIRLRAAENLAKYCGLLEPQPIDNPKEPPIVYVVLPETARE